MSAPYIHNAADTKSMISVWREDGPEPMVLIYIDRLDEPYEELVIRYSDVDHLIRALKGFLDEQVR